MIRPELSRQSADALNEELARPASEDADVRLILVTRDERAIEDLSASPDSFVMISGNLPIAHRWFRQRCALVIPTSPTGQSGADVDVVILDPCNDRVPLAYRLPDELAHRCHAFDFGKVTFAVAGLRKTVQRVTFHEAWRDADISFMTEDIPEDPIQLRIEARGSIWRGGLPEDRLAQGIVMGGTGRSVLPGRSQVSREHLLVRREGDCVVFYDTLSSHGTHVGGERVRRVAISAPQNGRVNPEGIVLALPEGIRIALTDDSADMEPGDTFDGVVEIVNASADEVIATLWWDGRRVRGSPPGFMRDIMSKIRRFGPKGRILSPACGPEFLRFLPYLVSNGYLSTRHVNRDPPA